MSVGIPPTEGPPILVASQPDAHRFPRRSVILVEHGAGQRYATPHPGYSGGDGRDNVALFLCPNPDVAAANRAAYPATPAAVVGSPHLEALRRRRPETVDPQTAAVSFHWHCTLWPEAGTSFGFYTPVLPELPRSGFEMIGHGHPRIYGQLLRSWRQWGYRPVQWWPDVVAEAGLYVCDNSSTLFEAAALDIPVVVLNQPRYRRDLDLGLRFWTWADIGPQVEKPDDLVGAMVLAASEPGRYAGRRAEMAAAVFGEIDGSAHRAVQAIREHLAV